MKSGSLCALLWRILSWCTRKPVTLKACAIPGRLNVIADKLSRLDQTIQTEWSLHPKVFQALCSQWHQPQVDVFATGFNTNHHSLCHQSQTPRHGQWMHSAFPGRTWTHMPSHQQPSWASGGEVAGLPMQQNDPDCTEMAQHALVLGSSGNVKSDPTVSAQHTKPSVSAIQPGPTQELVKPESACMAHRASAIKEQAFCDSVAAQIEAPQRGSTRSVYEASGPFFTKWCLSNQVDFRAPPLKAIADFLLYLFQDRKLQPGTIDGHRSPIADKLGNVPINVNKNEHLTRLPDSFHRDSPKGRRGIPSWNLSLVLHQLTTAESLKEASLKHLTFKTVFLMVLGSGKCRSCNPCLVT